MKLRLSIIIILGLCSVLTSCYYDKEDQLYPAENVVACDTTNITYTAVMKSFFDTRCATSACHQPGMQSPDLSTFASASASASTLYSSALNANHSSRYSASACEKTQLQIWCNNPLN